MPDYTLSAKVTGDSSSYQRAMEEADNSTKQFQTNTSSLGSKLAGTLKTGLSVAVGAIAGVATAMGAGAVAGLKYNATIEQYETSFEVMTGSAEKAAEVVERLKKLGAETPFELPQLADVTQLLMNYGFTADEAIDRMKMLGDISQGSADKMSRIAMAYGQMSSAGKVQLEDVKQMIEAGFNPLQEISESTGESMESLYDRISNGTLAVDEITASMQRATSEGGKYYQSMEKQSQTVAGMISTLKDNAQQLLGEVVKPLTEGVATKILPAAISAIDQLTVAFQTGGTAGLIAAGTKVLADVVLGIAQALPSLIDTSVQIIQSLVTNLSANMPQLLIAGAQIIASLISGIGQLLYMVSALALSIITTLVSGLIMNAPQLMMEANAMFTNFCLQIQMRLPELIQNGASMISNLLLGLLNNAPQIIQQAGTMLTNYVDTILSMLPTILQAAADIIISLLTGLISNAPQIISQAGTMLVDYAATIASHLPEILQKGIEIIGQLLAGIIREAPSLIAAIPGIVADIGSAFLDKDWIGIGLDIISGIASGIASAAGNLVDAAVSAASNAVNTVKGWLGIASPSKVMRDEVGKYMALGMGVGFEENIPLQDINSALGRAVNKISDHYAEVGRSINPVDAIVGTSRVAETYQADVSNIFDGVTIIVDNTTNIDGMPIYKKASDFTIRKIGDQQKALLKAKGAFA